MTERRCVQHFKKLLVVGILLAAAGLCGPSAVVLGTISYPDNRPAAEVRVSLAGQFRYTDVQGRYRIDGVPFGQHQVRIDRAGRVLKEVQVNIYSSPFWLNEVVPMFP